VPKELLDLPNKGVAGELQVDEVEETDFLWFLLLV